MLIARFHPNADIRARGIDRAGVVTSEKRTRRATGENHGFHFGLKFRYHLSDRLAAMVTIRIKETRLAQNVQVVRLDDQAAFTTRASRVAFVSIHARLMIPPFVCASRLLRAVCESVSNGKPTPESLLPFTT